MKHSKLQFFVVDDETYDLKPIYNALNQSVLQGEYEVTECECVEEIPAQLLGTVNVTGLQTIKSIAENGSKIDIALLDRMFEKEFQTDIDTGPRKIISLLRQIAPDCKILLLSKKGGMARDTYATIKGVPNTTFRTIGKFDPQLAVKTILDIVKEWTIDFLRKKVDREKKEQIIRAITKNEPQELPEINTELGTWFPKTYLVPYFLYLETEVGKEPDQASLTPDEIIGIIKNKYQPKLTAWVSITTNFEAPLSEYYDRYMHWPERAVGKLNRKAEDYIRKYLNAEANMTALATHDYNFKADIRSGSESFDFVPQFETILIGRRIAIGLYILGYSENAIWYALRKNPEIYSTLSEEEKTAARPSQLFTTYFALSLKNEVDRTSKSGEFYTLENLLEEEIEWLEDFFSLSPADTTFLNYFIQEMQSELRAVSNSPIVKQKKTIISIEEARTIISKLMSLLESENLKGSFFEMIDEDLPTAQISQDLKTFIDECRISLKQH